MSVKALNQAIRRNKLRFPEDFVFQLTVDEVKNLAGAKRWRVRFGYPMAPRITASAASVSRNTSDAATRVRVCSM